MKFCFVIQNTGQTPLIDVTLNDITLNVDLTSSLSGLTNQDNDGFADDLAIGASATAEYITTANSNIENTAIAVGSGQQSQDMASATIYFCGDGTVNPNEQCDDGNMTSGDGCSAQCLNEFCGDGTTQAGLGEQCDDGNTNSEDGCDAQCQTEFCGDGTTQAGLGEECDDGNTTSGDGCDATCSVEVEVDCFGVPNGTAVLDRCGVCGGDGMDCLECTSFDNSAAQFSLDGGVDRVRSLVKRSGRILFKRAKSRATKALAKDIIRMSNDLYQEGWATVWSVPTTGTSCTNEVFCVQSDFSAEVDQYTSVLDSLQDLGKTAISKVRKIAKRKKFGAQILKELALAVQENAALSAQLTTLSSQCDDAQA